MTAPTHGVRNLREELVQRAMEGDHAAFEALVRPEFDRLYGLAGLLIGDSARAEDAVQEALVRAWRDLPRLRDRASFGPWLRRLVVNAARDEGRRIGRRRRETELTPAHDRGGAALELDAILDRDELAGPFKRLRQEERTVIALRYYSDLSTAEAASSLGLGEVAFRSRLHRAVKALGAALAADARSVSGPEGRWT